MSSGGNCLGRCRKQHHRLDDFPKYGVFVIQAVELELAVLGDSFGEGSDHRRSS
jgi:hypothetical protein